MFRLEGWRPLAHVLKSLWLAIRITAKALYRALISMLRRDKLTQAIAHGEHEAARRHLAPHPDVEAMTPPSALNHEVENIVQAPR